MFGLFHGERALQRAVCAGITLKTFSQLHLEPLIEDHFSETFPDTGFKIGMASGILVVKKVGVRGTNEPVWAGKPVNWAAKCAHKADRHQLIVTSAVYDKIAANQYLTHSCACGTPTPIWVDELVEKLDKHGLCKRLVSRWCTTHGSEYCQAVLDGKTRREDMEPGLAA